MDQGVGRRHQAALLAKAVEGVAIAQEDETPLVARAGGLLVEHAPVAEREWRQDEEAAGNHPAARLQFIAGREEGEGQQQDRQHGADQGDHVQARVVHAHHVGAGAVAVDEVEGGDEGEVRREQGAGYEVLGHAAVEADQVEDDEQRDAVEDQQHDGCFPIRDHADAPNRDWTGTDLKGFARGRLLRGRRAGRACCRPRGRPRAGRPGRRCSQRGRTLARAGRPSRRRRCARTPR